MPLAMVEVTIQKNNTIQSKQAITGDVTCWLDSNHIKSGK